MLWLFLPIIAVSSFGLTWALRRYALSRSLIDIPNSRSSHTTPTPRGGGIAIVVSFLIAIVAMLFLDMLQLNQALALLGAGVLVAVLGFLDDHGHIAARWRLLGHFLAAFWALYWIGGLAPISVFGEKIELGIFGYAVSAMFLVWMLNLYNFMDGIDGIASVEAITVCIGVAFLYWVQSGAAISAPILLACSVLGFLCWNFPPAKIFMGDAGSGFLGIILGIFALQAAWVSSDLFWAWLILMGVFIVDATVTLIRRLLRGEKVYEAHRSHAYQFASRHYKRHLPVTLATGMITILWLLPIAFLVVDGKLEGVLGLLLAYVPLLLLALKFQAGEVELR
ncbi:Undecaprenyl-phosphate alpha-N-acetylglucosaminyl 1-phosphate transferase [Pseudomonas chlororaphis]|uniref:MraY family glycosyltransferase n=1 Tax=Pseudomonas chlororaphis TaxID=587753 RepID=UPI000F5675AD|nr:glycosyltransferase family 4 protein [Pseudomonas chlororaphis]AZD09714.1 Undecaprenyl-phosphate alpha-N-acetylglucosaminyl 1-phosphate transferase [Pseudomonas chlororaphis]